MTYLGTYRLFECNFCNQQQFTQLFPKGWYWIKSGMGNQIQHACGTCAEQIPKNKKRKAGQNN